MLEAASGTTVDGDLARRDGRWKKEGRTAYLERGLPGLSGIMWLADYLRYTTTLLYLSILRRGFETFHEHQFIQSDPLSQYILDQLHYLAYLLG